MKKKLLGQEDGYKICVVDGNEIRNKMNCEFTNFGQHGRFEFIPKDEIWLDEEHGRGEREPFVAHAIKEAEEMRNGKSYDEAYEEGLAEENKYREKAKQNVYKKILTYVGDTKVWLVDGKAVRSGYDKNFVQGGHSKVYSFIPKDEIWIDDDLSEEERKPVIIHELNEVGLMRKGIPYNKAHFRSNIKENKFRKLFKKNKYPSLKVIQ
jgi:hypothetical protein